MKPEIDMCVYASIRIKKLVCLRDDMTCQMCGSQENLTIDHKIPRVIRRRIGDTPKTVDEAFKEINNLWLLCIPCHEWKTVVVDRLPSSRKDDRLSPLKIRWNGNHKLYTGKI